MTGPVALRAGRAGTPGSAGRLAGARRASLAVALIVGAALAVSACGGTGAGESRTVPPGRPASAGGVERVRAVPPGGGVGVAGGAGQRPSLSQAAVRARYLAAVAPAEAAFAKLSAELATLVPTTPATRVEAEVRPAAAAIARAARRLYALSRLAGGARGKDLFAVVVADNEVWQALEDLAAGWSSRSFELSSWEGAFSEALRRADAAASTVRRALAAQPGRTRSAPL